MTERRSAVATLDNRASRSFVLDQRIHNRYIRPVTNLRHCRAPTTASERPTPSPWTNAFTSGDLAVRDPFQEAAHSDAKM